MKVWVVSLSAGAGNSGVSAFAGRKSKAASCPEVSFTGRACGPFVGRGGERLIQYLAWRETRRAVARESLRRESADGIIQSCAAVGMLLPYYCLCVGYNTPRVAQRLALVLGASYQLAPKLFPALNAGEIFKSCFQSKSCHLPAN